MTLHEFTKSETIHSSKSHGGHMSSNERVSPTESDNDSNKQPRIKSKPETKYPDVNIRNRQTKEGVGLSLALVISVALTFFLWRLSGAWWSLPLLAGVAGVIGGLLHSLKWFYKTIGDGEWEWDRGWWRYLNPLVSGILGLSIYAVFRSGLATKTIGQGLPGTEGFYAYSVGFLTGLFADNAMSKLRDIAYAVFGPTARPPSKPKADYDRGKDDQQRGNGGSSHD